MGYRNGASWPLPDYGGVKSRANEHWCSQCPDCPIRRELMALDIKAAQPEMPEAEYLEHVSVVTHRNRMQLEKQCFDASMRNGATVEQARARIQDAFKDVVGHLEHVKKPTTSEPPIADALPRVPRKEALPVSGLFPSSLEAPQIKAVQRSPAIIQNDGEPLVWVDSPLEALAEKEQQLKTQGAPKKVEKRNYKQLLATGAKRAAGKVGVRLVAKKIKEALGDRYPVILDVLPESVTNTLLCAAVNMLAEANPEMPMAQAVAEATSLALDSLVTDLVGDMMEAVGESLIPVFEELGKLAAAKKSSKKLPASQE